MSTVWLVIPTYNEAENLEKIVLAAGEQLAVAAPADHRVLIVDDNSPDGTGAIADRLAERLDWVDVLHRPGKAGLGHAYLAGFARALEGGAQLVIEMDADFSHNPAYLPTCWRPPSTPTSSWARAMSPAAESATGDCCAG